MFENINNLRKEVDKRPLQPDLMNIADFKHTEISSLYEMDRMKRFEKRILQKYSRIWIYRCTMLLSGNG